ncbi:MAG: hypothetical protein AB1480_05790 [Nitrospirota bacterium]
MKSNKKSVKKPRSKQLTLREKRLIAALPTAKSVSEAMRIAGYSESVINSGKARRDALQKPTIQEAMEANGLTDQCFLNVLKDGLSSHKVISANVILMGKNGEPGEGMKDANSMTKDFIEVPDYTVRHKYLETGLKLKGYLRDKVDIEHSIETHEERLKRLQGKT